MVGTGGNFSCIGAMYTLKFDIMPFSDQKWLRLGANFFKAETRDEWAQTRNKYNLFIFILFIHCWFKGGNMNASEERERGVILGQIFLTRGKKIFSAPMT